MNLTASFAVLAAALVVAGGAQAGQCPADQTRPGALTSGSPTTQGATAVDLGDIPLGAEFPGMEGRHLHMRRVTIAPGGVTAWHNHTGRPQLTTILAGTMTEYRADCAVPIQFPTGDVSREFGATNHYWRNNGTEPAVILGVDIEGDAAPAVYAPPK